MYNRVSAVSQSADIVIALIVDDGRVLVRPRTGDAAMTGLWEFPGGKVEAGESHAAAVVREVWEEMALDVAVIAPVVALSHTYQDRRVSMYAYLCRVLDGAPARGRWISISEVRALAMPAANPALVDALRWRLGA